MKVKVKLQDDYKNKYGNEKNNKNENMNENKNEENKIIEKLHYRLQLWDTAGQPRFRSLVPSYLRNSHCVVICF